MHRGRQCEQRRTEAEDGATQLNAEDGQQTARSQEKGREQTLLTTLKGTNLADSLILDFRPLKL